jgi:hypothetical protein
VFTVWANVFEAGRLQPGETLLVPRRDQRDRHDRHRHGQGPRRERDRHRPGRGEGGGRRRMGADLAIDASAEDFGRGGDAAAGRT